MKLRIVSGSLKGRYLIIPERDCSFRPTGERVREAVADILTPRIEGASIADICAGSGAFGFELLSRGARRCVFVESDRHRVKLMQTHAERFGITGRCGMVAGDLDAFLCGCSERFDIIYFDPPYDDRQCDRVIPSLLTLLSDEGVLVHECRSRRKGGAMAEPAVNDPPPFDRRRYGETEVRFFTKTGVRESGV
jgi:16S rRNA (guanine966-N2)-methyltransferase